MANVGMAAPAIASLLLPNYCPNNGLVGTSNRISHPLAGHLRVYLNNRNAPVSLLHR